MKKVQVGKDQEKAQSEKIPTPKTEVGKSQTNNQVLCYVPGVTRRLRKPTSWLASNKLCLKFNKSI